MRWFKSYIIGFFALFSVIFLSGNFLLFSQTAPVNLTGGTSCTGGSAYTYSNMLNCTNTPTFNVDLSGDPSATWTSNPTCRSGSCCGTDNNCVQFTILLSPDAEGLIFSIPTGCGAVPTGALFYQVGCGPILLLLKIMQRLVAYLPVRIPLPLPI